MDFILGFIMGAIFLTIPIVDIIRARSIKQNGVEVDAVVLRTEKSGTHQISYYPVFEYHYEGETIEKRHNTVTTSPKYKNGDIVRIIIHKDNPKQFLVQNDTTRTIVIIFLAFLGVVTLIYSCFLLYNYPGIPPQ